MMWASKSNIIVFYSSMAASKTTPLSSHYKDSIRSIVKAYSVWGSSKHLFLLTWPAVLCTLLVDHLLDSPSKQHPWRVMVKGLERFAGAVGFLSGNAAGSLLPVSRGGGVTALPILVSLAVSLSVSLALGQRAERPLLPHPFHAACMLGIQLPPLRHRRSPETLATGLFHSSLPLLFLLWLWFSSCTDFPPNSPPLLVNLSRSLLQSIQSSTHSTCRKRERQSSDNTNPSASSSKAHTYPSLSAPPPTAASPPLKPHLWTLVIHDFPSSKRNNLLIPPDPAFKIKFIFPALILEKLSFRKLGFKPSSRLSQ